MSVGLAPGSRAWCVFHRVPMTLHPAVQRRPPDAEFPRDAMHGPALLASQVGMDHGANPEIFATPLTLDPLGRPNVET